MAFFSFNYECKKLNVFCEKRAFTLIEVMIVIALFAGIMAVAMPNLAVQKEADISTKLGRLAGDIRVTSDISILSRRPYRIAFNLMSGKYWLETTDFKDLSLASLPPGKDYTLEEEKELNEQFEQEFEKYKDLVGEEVQNPDSDEKIPIKSPLIKAENKLKWPIWRKSEGEEWSERSLVPELFISSFRSEHLKEATTLEDNESEEVIAYLYFFPIGYVEKAYMYINLRESDDNSSNKNTYTLTTNPDIGTAIIENGRNEIDFF